MLKRLSIIFSSIIIILLFACSAVFADTIFGASNDIPNSASRNGNTVVPIDSESYANSAVNQMVQALNNGQHIIIAGGTGGAVTSSMIQSVMSQVKPNGGSITVVAGINNDQTISMMQQYTSKQTVTVPGNGTGNQTPNSNASTYGYASQPGGSWTGTSITAYNYGQTLLTSTAPGNTTGGLLNYKFPTVPVYVAPPLFFPPRPSIVGSVSSHDAYPGQVLTLKATLGSATTSGKAVDNIGNTVQITGTGNFNYTVPTNMKIGDTITFTFYASNQWVDSIMGNTDYTFVENNMTVTATANPTTLAPTEWTSLSANTTGFSNKVTALAQPVQIDATKSTIAAGSGHTLAVRSDSTVWSAGSNTFGQLGNNSTANSSTPVQVSGLSSIVGVSAGDSTSMALRSDGIVFVWGRGTEGQLGNGTYSNSSTPVQVPGLSNIVSISCGGYHCMALRKDGAVFVWGYGYNGELGNNTYSCSATPLQVQNLPKITCISAGAYHCLAVAYDGTAWAWGYNNYGQLGDGTTTNRAVPVQVIGITNAKFVSAGMYHSTLQTTDNTFFSWGWNAYGQLGTGNTSDSSTPVSMSGWGGQAIAAGGYSTTVIGSDNAVYCVGYGGDGQLGNGTNNSSASFVGTGLSNTLRIASGPYDCRTVIAITADYSAHIWGQNAYGQFADSNSTSSNSPTDYSSTKNIAKALLVNQQYDLYWMVLKSDGSVWAYGNNGEYQLGIAGSNGTDIWTPTQVTSGMVDISLGPSGGNTYNTYGVKYDGTVWEWGQCSEIYSGWGRNRTFVGEGPPIQITALSNVASIATGNGTMYFVKKDGTVCDINGNTVPGISNVTKATSCAGVVLMIKSDGTVWSYGNDYSGTAGLGGVSPNSYAMQISGLSGIVDIKGINSNVLALKSDGTVYHWGELYDPVSGNPVYGSSTPSQVSGLSNIKFLIINSYNLYAIDNSGNGWRWGWFSDATTGHSSLTYPPVSTTTVLPWGVYSLGSASYSTIPANVFKVCDDYDGGSVSFISTDGTYGPVNVFASSSISYSIGAQSSYTPITINFTPNDYSYPQSNSWTASLQVPTNAPINSQLILKVTSQSPWINTGDCKQQSVSTSIVLNIKNTIKLSNASISTTHVSPGQTITVSTASTGYALGVVAYGTNPSNPSNPIAFNMNANTAVATIPKNNTWWVNFTIPSNAPTGAYTIWLVGYNNVFINQPNSIPLYLNVTVGSPPLEITSVSATDPVWSHRSNLNLINATDLSTFSTWNSSDGWQSVGVQQSDGFWKVPKVSNTGHTNSEILMSDQYTVSAGQTYTESFYYKTDGTDNSDIQIVFWTGPRWVAVPATVTNLGNGIKQATASFTINSGETTLRALDTLPPSGNWNNISFANGQLYLSNQNIVNVNATTSGSTSYIKLSVSGQTQTNGVVSPFTISLPNMLTGNNTNWWQSYQVPDNVPDGSVLTFSMTSVSPSGVFYGPVYTAVTVNRYLTVTGHVSTQTAAPGQAVPIDATTNGYASSVSVQDNFSSNSSTLNPIGSITSAGNMWTGNYTVPVTAKIGQTITLTYTPRDLNNGTTFTGAPDQKTILVVNNPQIISTTFNQTYPYAGATTGAPTGTVDAIVLTSGWINSLNVSWDTSYSITATSYIDIDSNGTRQWTIKGLTVPINADVSNVIPTYLNIRAQTPYIEQSTGGYQTVTGKATLPIANTIVTTAQQLANPVINVSAGPATVTITVKTTGYATQAWAKTISGTTIQVGSTVTGTIPYSNTFTGTYTVPQGTPSQIFEIPVWATNTTAFVNQPQSNLDYIDLNIGGLPSIFSASLNPYTINLPATEADRTITLYTQTTGQVSGVQVSLSVNGGPSVTLPSGTMAATSGSAPGLVNWQGSYVVDPSTPDQTQLTFTFQAKDSGGNPSGPTITPHYVTVFHAKPPIVVITH